MNIKLIRPNYKRYIITFLDIIKAPFVFMISIFIIIPFLVLVFITSFTGRMPYNSGICLKHPFFHKWKITKTKGCDTHDYTPYGDEYMGFSEFNVKCEKCGIRKNLEVEMDFEEYKYITKENKLSTSGRFIHRQKVLL